MSNSGQILNQLISSKFRVRQYQSPQEQIILQSAKEESQMNFNQNLATLRSQLTSQRQHETANRKDVKQSIFNYIKERVKSVEKVKEQQYNQKDVNAQMLSKANEIKVKLKNMNLSKGKIKSAVNKINVEKEKSQIDNINNESLLKLSNLIDQRKSRNNSNTNSKVALLSHQSQQASPKMISELIKVRKHQSLLPPEFTANFSKVQRSQRNNSQQIYFNNILSSDNQSIYSDRFRESKNLGSQQNILLIGDEVQKEKEK